jgi:hypothetical protein
LLAPVLARRLALGPLAGLALLALAACDVPPPEPLPAPEPAAAPEPEPPRRASPPAPAEPSEESLALAQYYRRVQADLLDQGLLRGDEDAPDAPFTDTMLARNFVEIALFNEYATGQIGDARGESRLNRWEGPIRLELEFGASVPEGQRTRDRAQVAAYAARLSALTGVPIAPVEEGGNFHVAFLGEDEREAFGPQLRDLVPGIAESSVRTVVNLPKSTMCLVITFAGGEGGATNRAVVVIRAEHPDLIRTNCIHEELAQGMGLPNDSPTARPSIFSDTDEFGRLTRHDELLLRMLYDPRMRVGMTVDEAAPIAREVAAELLGEQVAGAS